MQLYLDQLRVDQGRMPLSGVEGAGRGIQRWEDLRAYVAIDNKKVLNSLGIIGKWYNVGFPEDKTGSSEVKITWSDTGKSIPDESIKKHMMELAVVCADGRCCKGLGRLTTAFCIQYVDFLNAKRKVNADGGYTYIIATLGKKQGSVNPKFAKILADFGFKKARTPHSKLLCPPTQTREGQCRSHEEECCERRGLGGWMGTPRPRPRHSPCLFPGRWQVDLKNDVGEPWRSGGVRIEVQAGAAYAFSSWDSPRRAILWQAMMLKRPRGATFLPYANIEELIRITSEAQPRATPAPRTKPQRARPSSGGKATGMKLAVVCNGAKRYAKRRLPADYVYVPPPPRGSLKRNCKRKGAAAQEDDIFDDEVGEAERRLNDFAVHQVVSPGLHVQKRARHDSRPETPPSSDDSIPLTELAILNGHGSGATQSLLVSHPHNPVRRLTHVA